MRRRPFKIPTSELKEEFPPSGEFIASHDTKFPRLAELRLATGQGTTKEEIVLVAELWAGEGILYDPQTHTEVAVWFDEASLDLTLTGCDIKSGTRFGERRAPDEAKIVEVAKESVSTGTKLSAKAGLDVNADQVPLIPGLLPSLRAEIFRQTSTTTNSVTKRESGGTKSVVASGSGWQIRRIQLSSKSESGAELYKYISTDDRLCDLVIRQGAKSARVEAFVNVYPTALRYRVNAVGAIKKFKTKLTTNQDKVIRLLLKSGVGPVTTNGLRLASATLRNKPTHRKRVMSNG